jgi:Methane oxygenase PmoA
MVFRFLPGLVSSAVFGELAASEVIVIENADTIQIQRGDMTVLEYHKTEIAVPAGVDPAFRRSGFIHPLNTPAGEPITGIQPEDHYHHLGLWHAWVKARHGEDNPDFWNLKEKTGRVRYAKTRSLDDDGFTVEQEHVAYKGADRIETVVLREELTIGVRFEEGRHIIRYQVAQTNVTDTPLELPAYRYGGCFAYRARLDWNHTNSEVLTSEGLDRSNSHATRARWVRFSGPTAQGSASLAVLFAPDNHDFPQRIRTWPADTHHGAIFFNVAPTQESDWSIPPGETIRMAYTLIVTDDVPAAEAVEAWWQEMMK